MFLKSEKRQVLLPQRTRKFVLKAWKGIVLAFIATVLLAILVASVFARAQASQLNSPSQQLQDINYPDPSNQNTLPDSVKVTGDGETVLLRAAVTEGRQIYECQTSASDPSGFAWKLQAPFALLKADDGINVIHSTDPTWLDTEDESEVKATVAQYTNPDGTIVSASVAVDNNSIPWLRLTITEHRGNVGLFSKVDQIQRLYTAGGHAPKGGCNQNTANNHAIVSIAYTAEYIFWGH